MVTLFLDIDGVLNHSGCPWTDSCTIDPDCLACYFSLIRQLGSYEVDYEVILTSSWRFSKDKRGFLRSIGIEWSDKPVLSKLGATRAIEITQFVKDFKIDPSNVIILDDDPGLMLLDDVLRDRWVKTSFNKKGLTPEHVKQSLEKLQ